MAVTPRYPVLLLLSLLMLPQLLLLVSSSTLANTFFYYLSTTMFCSASTLSTASLPLPSPSAPSELERSSSPSSMVSQIFASCYTPPSPTHDSTAP